MCEEATFTRRHYRALERAFREVEPPFVDGVKYETWRECLRSVADVLTESNPGFNWERFSHGASK